ncbi:MAG TPA: hypothetical protein VES91_01630, partial [Burkholderiaceae bacterium]|nr:hypothetical protein [Burkholderiaceae bacterium]
DLNKRETPQEYLHARVKANKFANETKIDGSAFPSHTAIARLATPYGARDTRVMVLFHDNRAFTFFATAKDDAAFARLDPQFLEVARSLHTLSASERSIADGLQVRVQRARAGDSFAALAKRSPLNEHAELTLRLINDKFPSGEPVAGELIKTVE